LENGANLEIENVKINVIQRLGLHRFKVGDLIKAKLRNGTWIYARVFEVGERPGTLIGIYKLPESNPEATNWATQPFCLKAHYVFEKSIDDQSPWIFVKNTILSDADMRPIPQRRLSVSELSAPLTRANYFYELMENPATPHIKKTFA